MLSRRMLKWAGSRKKSVLFGGHAIYRVGQLVAERAVLEQQIAVFLDVVQVMRLERLRRRPSTMLRLFGGKRMRCASR